MNHFVSDIFLLHIFSEMYAFTQTVAQQQGSHPQIFLPPRAPHLQMPKVAVCALYTVHRRFLFR